MARDFSAFIAETGLAVPTIEIVDVGANRLENYETIYQPLLDRGLARLTGFEPDPRPFAQLKARNKPNETYLPFAVGDGKAHELRLCGMSGMNSLLEPNHALLAHTFFHGRWARVQGRFRMNTKRLDDVSEVRAMDYLKIDIQGAELMVFEHAVERLKDCVAVHTEAMFVPMYVGQPLYQDQAAFLSRFGMLAHRFIEMRSLPLKPFMVHNDPHHPISQVFWTDAVFIKDFMRFDELSADQLVKLAAILNDLYGSIDVAHLALQAYDRKSGTDFAPRYQAFLIRPTEPAAPSRA